MQPRRQTPSNAALCSAIEKGLLRPYGGHWCVKLGRRLRIYQNRHVERLAAAHGYTIEGKRVVPAYAEFSA